jgi:multicomponent K+:H+ antiporter subunit E
MTRFPLAFIVLLGLWLLLNESVSPAQILLGSAVALAGSWAFSFLGPPGSRIRRPPVVLRLCLTVAADIVRSNIAVAALALKPGGSSRRSGFVEIPLQLHDPYGLAVLAVIITSTPGTLWASYDSKSRVLIIHVLDLIDGPEWVQTIKSRYEQPLREIFE